MTLTVVGTGVSVSGAPVDGTYPVNYQYSQDTPKARVRKYLGGPAQDLYADLSATVGTSQLLSERQVRRRRLIVTPQYDQDAFPSNIPQISAVMRRRQGAGSAHRHDGLDGELGPDRAGLGARYAYGGGAEADELC